MRLIAQDLGHYELAEVRRFSAEWERTASLALRQGDPAAIRAYDARGRIRGAPEREAQRQAVALYVADHLLGRDVLLLAGTNEEAARLAAMVRQQLVRLGMLQARTEVTLADTAHLYVTPTLARESLYVGMTRGREANTAHVVTGPDPVPGREPMVQAPPEAVLEEILARTDANLTATETMRAAQGFATGSRHLFAMWSAATRAEAYRAIDAGLAARLSPAEYRRYEQESQRPILQRQVRAPELAVHCRLRRRPGEISLGWIG